MEEKQRAGPKGGEKKHPATPKKTLLTKQFTISTQVGTLRIRLTRNLGLAIFIVISPKIPWFYGKSSEKQEGKGGRKKKRTGVNQAIDPPPDFSQVQTERERDKENCPNVAPKVRIAVTSHGKCIVSCSLTCPIFFSLTEQGQLGSKPSPSKDFFFLSARSSHCGRDQSSWSGLRVWRFQASPAFKFPAISSYAESERIMQPANDVKMGE